MKEKKRDYTMIISIIIVLALIIIWLAFFYWNLDTALEHRAQIGDSFGSLNALFSALALSGVVFTILLQRKELGYQKDELKETRKEFQIQNQTLKIQRFENTFFSLLNLHHQIVTGIDHEITIKMKNPNKISVFDKPGEDDQLTNSILKGRDVFEFSFRALNKDLNKENVIPDQSIDLDYNILNETYEIISETKLDNVHLVYQSHYDKWKTDYSHYFRNLYRIIKFVDNSSFLDNKENLSQSDRDILKRKEFEEKYKYTSMLRAQLSDSELTWLFYNCVTEYGSEKFKPLIEKYGFLKNMDWFGIHPNLILKYKKSAFINPMKYD